MSNHPTRESKYPSNSVDLDWETYIGPALELIYERSSPELRSIWFKIEGMLGLAKPIKGIGDWEFPYLYLPEHEMYYGKFNLRTLIPNGLKQPNNKSYENNSFQDNPDGRILDMNKAGIKSQVLHPSHSIFSSLSLGEAIAIGFVEAYNLYIEEFCSSEPERLKFVLQLYGGNPYWSYTEVKRYLNKKALAGVSIMMPNQISPDHPEFDVLWEVIGESNLPLILKKENFARHWNLKRILNTLLSRDIFRRFNINKVVLIGYSSTELKALWDMIEMQNWIERVVESNLYIATRNKDTNFKHINIPRLYASGYPFSIK